MSTSVASYIIPLLTTLKRKAWWSALTEPLNQVYVVQAIRLYGTIIYHGYYSPDKTLQKKTYATLLLVSWYLENPYDYLVSFLNQKMNALNTHRLRIILPNISRPYTITPPRQHNRLSYVEKALFLPETTHMYLRIDSHKPPLYSVHKGPFKVLDKSEKYFIIDFRTHTDKVTIDRLKSAELSVDELNQDAFTNFIAMSPSTQPPYTFDRDTHTAYKTGTGRSVRLFT